MKKTITQILVLWTLLFAWAVQPVFQAEAASPQVTADSFTIAGRTFTGNTLNTLIVLMGSIASSANTKSTTLRRSNGAASVSAGYQVTAGKTLTVWACECIGRTATGIDFYLGYGDNDVGLNFTGTPTNGTGWTASTTPVCLDNLASQNTLAVPLLTKIPATKFPYFTNNGGTVIETFICYGTES